MQLLCNQKCDGFSDCCTRLRLLYLRVARELSPTNQKTLANQSTPAFAKDIPTTFRSRIRFATLRPDFTRCCSESISYVRVKCPVFAQRATAWEQLCNQVCMSAWLALIAVTDHESCILFFQIGATDLRSRLDATRIYFCD